jgi:phosphatidylglycerophosphate synthase
MPAPSVAELRRVAQPEGVLGRRSGEHWAGRLYMRHVSIYATRVLVALRVAPNTVTAGMIVIGLLAGPALLLPGVWGAALAALLVQLYLLLDCSDGEVARWTGRTSISGVYLDRVGHYLCEAAFMVGLGLRAGGLEVGGYAMLGTLAALGVVLIKAETDLVDVARARAGLPAAEDASAAPRSSGVALARRLAAGLRLHRLLGAVEASLLVLAVAVVDAVRGDLRATQVTVVVLVVVAGLQLVAHLVSILASRRLA